MSFSTDIRGKENSISLYNTLNVPDLRTNVISVGKITGYGFGDLYYVPETVQKACSTVPNSINSRLSIKNLNLWHCRLGHLNAKDLVELRGPKWTEYKVFRQRIKL